MDVFEIRLENVRIRANHGVYEFERTRGNDFEVNLSVKYPAPENEVIKEDNLFYTLSYVSLFEIVKEEMETPRNLIETVAAAIVNRIKTEFPVCTSIQCKISKLNAPIPDFSGVTSVSFSSSE